MPRASSRISSLVIAEAFLGGNDDGFHCAGLRAEAMHRLLQALDQVVEGHGGSVIGAELAEKSGIWPGYIGAGQLRIGSGVVD